MYETELEEAALEEAYMRGEDAEIMRAIYDDRDPWEEELGDILPDYDD